MVLPTASPWRPARARCTWRTNWQPVPIGRSNRRIRVMSLAQAEPGQERLQRRPSIGRLGTRGLPADGVAGAGVDSRVATPGALSSAARWRAAEYQAPRFRVATRATRLFDGESVEQALAVASGVARCAERKARWIIERQLVRLDQLNSEIQGVEQRLEATTEGDPIVAQLLTQKGVGLITAVTMGRDRPLRPIWQRQATGAILWAVAAQRIERPTPSRRGFDQGRQSAITGDADRGRALPAAFRRTLANPGPTVVGAASRSAWSLLQLPIVGWRGLHHQLASLHA